MDQFGLMFALASVIGWGMLSVITGRLLIDQAGMGRTVSPQPVHA